MIDQYSFISSPPAETSPLHLVAARPSWRLILQSGVGLFRTVGLPLGLFLRQELALSGAQIKRVEVLILNGMPVDDPETAIVPDRARLALAAGLPGIAGLAMKKGSPVGALRGGITHVESRRPEPRPGFVSLALYSLVLPMLASDFLKFGIVVTSAQVRRYASFAPEDFCLFESRRLTISDLLRELSGRTTLPVFMLTADLVD